MSDINDRVIEAVRDTMLRYPKVDQSQALRIALDADPALATAYHTASATGLDPGFNHPEPRGMVRNIPIAEVGIPKHQHFSQLSPAAKRMELRRMGADEPQRPGCTYLHRLGGPDVPGSGFFEVVA